MFVARASEGALKPPRNTWLKTFLMNIFEKENENIKVEGKAVRVKQFSIDS